jgi:UPF0042 nucleotide-binding protein
MSKEKIKSKMKIVIITGLSGAGKTEALNDFEDIGYYCIDNIPARLLLNLIDYFSVENKTINEIAVAIDLRSGYFFEDIYKTLDKLKERKIEYKILFLEASKGSIIKRYSLTKRKHPLVENGNIGDGIEIEMGKMERLRKIADVIIDTSILDPKELRMAIAEGMGSEVGKEKLMQISITSFGYKHGVPESMDIIMDVRISKNPFYDDELKDLNGKDDKVIGFVLRHDENKKFITMFEKMLDFLIPNYISEGKRYLSIGIGCTGGRHRSVVITDKIYEYLKLRGYFIKLNHRDIDKDI